LVENQAPSKQASVHTFMAHLSWFIINCLNWK